MTDDLISREEALKVVNVYDYRGFTVEQVKTITDGCAEEISRLPTVDAVPVRHGKWVYHDDDVMPWNSCSLCGCTAFDLHGANYCPYCGAKMEE